MIHGDGPLVSVCIPVYNCEEYVGYAIESVLGQSYKNFELVIIEDHSTDRTLDIIRSYSDPRIRLVLNEARLGHKNNWNKALIEAKGKYIKLLPADDILYPGCLEKELEVSTDPGNNDVALVCCARHVINKNGKVLLKRSFKNRRGKLDGLEAIKENVRSGTNLIGEPAAVLISSAVVKTVGLFDDRHFYVIDLDYWCRILMTGNLYIIPEPLCAFRVAKGSVSVKVASSQNKDFKEFIKDLRGDKRYHLTRIDALIGESRAFSNRLLRQFFYRLVVKDD